MVLGRAGLLEVDLLVVMRNTVFHCPAWLNTQGWIIEKIGGRINVASRQGKETAFVVSLPVVLPEKK